MKKSILFLTIFTTVLASSYKSVSRAEPANKEKTNAEIAEDKKTEICKSMLTNNLLSLSKDSCRRLCAATPVAVDYSVQQKAALACSKEVGDESFRTFDKEQNYARREMLYDLSIRLINLSSWYVQSIVDEAINSVK